MPGRDIDMVFTGTRPGEKLHEVVSTNGLQPSSHHRVSVAEESQQAMVTLMNTVDSLVRMANSADRSGIRETLMPVTSQMWPTIELELDAFEDVDVSASG